KDTWLVLFALRRVILLRSYIRLMPSGIAFGSFGANKISLKPQGFNITLLEISRRWRGILKEYNCETRFTISLSFEIAERVLGSPNKWELPYKFPACSGIRQK
ncbi:MAG: hypothetical protein IKM48_01450, partial [Clostridia bacterium]|nr:hypothetical protein [Clostridia bacterium]